MHRRSGGYDNIATACLKTAATALLLAGLKPLFDPLASLRRKPLCQLRPQTFFEFVRRGAQEFQLGAIASAPLAEKQVQAKSKPLRHRKSAIHGFRLQSRCFLTSGRKKRDHSGENAFWLDGRAHFMRRRTSAGATLPKEWSNSVHIPYNPQTQKRRFSNLQALSCFNTKFLR